MNYRLNSDYSVILMSQRANAPYKDKVHPDGLTIEYEGHDVSRSSYDHNPKLDDQLTTLPSGRLTQNGLFAKAVDEYKSGNRKAEPVIKALIVGMVLASNGNGMIKTISMSNTIKIIPRRKNRS